MITVKTLLQEKLVTLGNKRPKYNTVVIMAGGAASGKGFVTSNLVGIEGKVLDVDELKKMALDSSLIRKRLETEYDLKPETLDLTNPEDVSLLHTVMVDIGIDKRRKDALYQSILQSKNNKPNLIFDATLKELSKLKTISDSVRQLGYEKKDIHIVWVVNELDTAIQQNAERSRRVDVNILKDTHRLVSYTLQGLIRDPSVLRQYMDGDLWFVFNKKYTDSVLKFSTNTPDIKKQFPKLANKGSFVKDVVYLKVKKQGKAPASIDSIGKQFVDKIKKYVPNPEVWK